MFDALGRANWSITIPHYYIKLNRPGFARDSISWEDRVMNRHKCYPQEVRERAVRLVLEHQENYNSQWAALTFIADKIGCTAETFRKWVRHAEV